MLEWQQPIIREFTVLLKNNGCVQLLPHPNQYIVAYKWVFKLKCKVESLIKHHNAHLIAKDFHQLTNANFDETFSRIIIPITICTIRSLQISSGWCKRQLNVKNDFHCCILV